MTLGTSIFLSSLVLALVALFITTKDKWNWKRIFIIPTIIIFSIATISVMYIYSQSYFDNLPKKQNSFLDISLGMSKQDVKFIKGEPENVLRDGNIFVYKNDNLEFAVYFKDESVWRVSLLQEPFSQGIQQINKYSTSKNIVHKFGEPSYVSESEGGLSRIYSYDKYNLFFTLEKDSVIMCGIYDSTKGPVQFFKEKMPNK